MKLTNIPYSISIILLITFFSCDPLPNEEIVQELLAYYHAYLDTRAKEIISCKEQMEECEAFFWITDIHWEPDLNARKASAMIRYLSDKTRIDKILNGGDTGIPR